MLISKRIIKFAIVVVIGIAISGCTQFPDNSDLFSNQTSTTKISFSPKTPKPSPTPAITATQSPEPTTALTPTPNIPTNPRTFEGIGEIASIEQNPDDGKWYGIDIADRAEIVYEEGEWIKFDRPLFGVNFDNFGIEVGNYAAKETIHSEGLDLTEIPASEIVRLKTPEGNFVNWGYQEGSLTWNSILDTREDIPAATNTELYFGRFSGYFIGVVNADILAYVIDNPDTNKLTHAPLFVFEIPNKYSRQIILTPISLDGNDRYYVSFDDTYHNVFGFENVSWNSMSAGNIIDLLSSNMARLRGQQCVLDFIFGHSSMTPDVWNTLSEHKGYNLTQSLDMAQFEFFNSGFSDW